MLAPWLELPGAAERIAAWSEISGLDLAPSRHHRDRRGDHRHRGDAAARRGRHAARTPGTDQAGPARRRRHGRRGTLRRRDRGLRDRRRHLRRRRRRAGRHPRRRDGQGLRGRADRHVRGARRRRGRGARPASRHSTWSPPTATPPDRSSPPARCRALDKLAEDPPAKARVRQLATAGAFHTRFMASALDGYAAAAAGVATGEPTATLLSNADGQPVTSAADAMSKLVAQLTRPVRWDLCTETMRAAQRSPRSSSSRPRARSSASPNENFGECRRTPSRPPQTWTGSPSSNQYNRTPSRTALHAGAPVTNE